MQLNARELVFFVVEALALQEPILQRLNHLRETAEHIESASYFSIRQVSLLPASATLHRIEYFARR